MRSPKHDPAGFTLIETLISLAAASLILAATYQFFATHHGIYKGQTERVAIEDNIRGAMDFVVRSVKHGTSFPAATVTGTALTFSYAEDFGVATSASGSTLVDSSKNWTDGGGNLINWTGCQVAVTRGTGRGQPPRTIASNTANTLTISGTWTATPDSTSAYKIVSQRQFSYNSANKTLLYQDISRNTAVAVVADSISNFNAAWDPKGQLNITMAAETSRALPDSGSKGTSELKSSVMVRN